MTSNFKSASIAQWIRDKSTTRQTRVQFPVVSFCKVGMTNSLDNLLDFPGPKTQKLKFLSLKTGKNKDCPRKVSPGCLKSSGLVKLSKQIRKMRGN